MNLILLLLEIMFFLRLCQKNGVAHPFSIVYFVAFFYFNSVYVDFLLFDRTPLLYTMGNTINVDFFSETFLYYNCIVFTFLSAFFFVSLVNGGKYTVVYYKKDHFFAFPNNEVLLNVILLLCIIYNLYSTYVGLSLTRFEKGGLQTPVTLVFRNFVNYFFILLFCLKFKKKTIIPLFFYASSILYFFLSFEREPLVILFLCMLYKYKTFTDVKILITLGPLLFFLLYIWKLFYASFLYDSGGGLASMELYLENSNFSFAGLDPLSSFMLMYDYLENPYIYENYYFTYISGVFYQLKRMLFASDYMTLSEYASSYYVNSEYGMAFSILLESILNLWYLGPIIIALSMNKVVKKVLLLQGKYGAGIIVATIYIIIKFMRTEFATILKLQVFALILALFLMNFLFVRFSRMT